ncbi:MAG TPA: hypothetical protein VG939_19600 [Caulobacteraceae bacterium]|nr:hypothetical protein [Caulobacteraceae bacterium]
MTVHAFQPAQPLGGDGAALGRVLDRARVARDSLVRVTGPAGLAAMIWLNRHGYIGAVYSHASIVGKCREPADVLLVPHACGPKELADMLATGECVRPDGLLIVQASGGDDLPGGYAGVLEDRGFAIEHVVADRGRTVHVARLAGVDGRLRAA